MVIKKIISGGQLGADLGGLYAAEMLDIPTGGWACKGWLTEQGPMPDVLKGFGLKEADKPGYPYRTELNVKDSDGTLLFGNVHSTGSKLTAELCDFKHHKKPFFNITIDNLKDEEDPYFVEWVRRWINHWDIAVLNVAGNRESVSPGIQDLAFKFMLRLLA